MNMTMMNMTMNMTKPADMTKPAMRKLATGTNTVVLTTLY